MSESPDTIHGRMKEGAHLAGYSLSRSMENLRWLLEDARFEQLSAGYRNVNDFLRDTAEAFRLLDIKPEERKQIAELVKELQPKASQRAIADMVGVDKDTVARDLGYERPGGNTPKAPEILDVFGGNTPSPPSLPPDDFNPVEQERKEQRREEKRQQRLEEIEEIRKGEIITPEGLFDVIIVDPPWPYGTSYDPLTRRIGSPYPEMSIKELMDLHLPASENAVLWLWTTHRFMPDAYMLAEHWEFDPKIILTWVKNRMGMGTWLRSQTEFCLLAIRGKPHWNLSNQTTVIHAPMREHSRKPDEFYGLVRELCWGRMVDYFSREKRNGFEQIGNEPKKYMV